MRRFHLFQPSAIITLVALAASLAGAQAQLSSELREKIDKIANDVLEKTGTPSVSLALVKDGQIVYAKAYGDAQLEPRRPAASEMRYSIGSGSKPFTAMALLLLQEQGKLSLDDKVSRFLPDLNRANEVTIRQLLSHTSGYQEFWPVDYVLPGMLQPVTSQKILDQWARQPLNFDPGTKWSISDTNYVIAGVIAEKASGMPLRQFLKDKIFTPLHMDSVVDIDQEKLSETDPVGYMRFGIGPQRPAVKEAKGWLFAGEELAMTAQDLGKWDISVMDQTLLKPSSYRELETVAVLKNGLGTPNGLAFGVNRQAGRRAVYTLGDISGFAAANTIFPDERVAVAVLANEDAGAPSEITRSIAPLLMAVEDPLAPQKLEQARKIFDGLQHGTLDRSQFTNNANGYFSDQALKDFADSLAPLGPPQQFIQTDKSLANGLTHRTFKIKFAQKTLNAQTAEASGGKLEQYLIESN
ncbi:MAG TPA: serine hydrolase domain-containing protein [Candidatus Angelobacter sp.]